MFSTQQQHGVNILAETTFTSRRVANLTLFLISELSLEFRVRVKIRVAVTVREITNLVGVLFLW